MKKGIAQKFDNTINPEILDVIKQTESMGYVVLKKGQSKEQNEKDFLALLMQDFEELKKEEIREKSQRKIHLEKERYAF